MPPNPFLNQDSVFRSFNRARIVSLPNVAQEVLGKTGYDLLSAESLREILRLHASALSLELNAPDIFYQFARCFHAPNTLPLAQQIARSYGRNLGFLLSMLWRGDPENRTARPEWTDAHWTFWPTITHIIFGGGLLASPFGEVALASAREVLAEYGLNSLKLTLSPFPAYLPIIGLARSNSANNTPKLIFDFGQTSIKRAVAEYQEGELIRLHLLPSLPSVCANIHSVERPLTEIHRQWKAMKDIIVSTMKETRPRWGKLTNQGICLACYLLNGHPSHLDKGCYGSLQFLAPNLTEFMQKELPQALLQAADIQLAHDGTAAAWAYSGMENALVLTLGTAIGNGFPPPDEGFSPLASEFKILSGEHA